MSIRNLDIYCDLFMRVRETQFLIFQWHPAFKMGARGAPFACIIDYGNQEGSCWDSLISKRNLKIIRMPSNTLINKANAIGYNFLQPGKSKLCLFMFIINLHS